MEYNSLSQIDEMDGHEFEYFCAQLLKDNGFHRVTVTKGSNDQGVDIIAKKDGHRFAIQCKRYQNSVGNRAVQEINAGKQYYDCDQAIVLTNSYFTPSAVSLAEKTGVWLWDRVALEKMLTAAGGVNLSGTIIQEPVRKQSDGWIDGCCGPFFVFIGFIVFYNICNLLISNSDRRVNIE